MKDWQGYRDLVRTAMLRRTGETILNSSISHAAVITQEAFSCAEKRVRILSHKLDSGCYDGVRAAARAFLADPDHSAQILVEAPLWDPEGNFEWEKHPFISALSDFTKPIGDKPARLEVKLVPKEYADRYKFNFLLLDDYGLRYEADRAQSAAIATFYPKGSDSGPVKNLEMIFNDLWGVSTPILN